VQPDPTLPSIPQHPAHGAPTAEEEAWADDWLRKFFHAPDLTQPTPRQRYILVPRFRYAGVEASIYAKMIGSERVPNPAAKWEELLVQQWHQKWRDTWLAEPHLPDEDEDSLQA
jgi:hypothetical protein